MIFPDFPVIFPPILILGKKNQPFNGITLQCGDGALGHNMRKAHPFFIDVAILIARFYETFRQVYFHLITFKCLELGRITLIF